MVYRQPAHDTVPTEPDDPDATLARFDASGRDGEDGRPGHPGDDGVQHGAHGRNGGDAGAATPGDAGGRIELRLRALDNGLIKLAGQRKRVGKRVVPLDEELDIGARGYIDVVARGGRGGDGGAGGRGGDGATGRRGSDATRSSSGDDGGPGGDGGDGGAATDGGDGGDGGVIEVTVAEPNMHVVMLLRASFEGGRGGDKGVNGSGGSGGRGGDGGSSYHWSETESYTDSSGNSQTRSTSHHRNGGSRGPNGYDGTPGRARVSAGGHGARGRFSITVEHPGGNQTYDAPFDLALDSFEHSCENEDGIYEPGERIQVKRLTVLNSGGMPTPLHQDMLVTLQQHGWVIPEAAELAVPRGLPAGAKHTFEDERLWFQIGDFSPKTPAEPLSCVEHIRTAATLPALPRELRKFERAIDEAVGKFVIRFPVETSPLESLRALAPGETSAVRFTLTNHAKTAFGTRADNGRRLTFHLRTHHSELGDEHVVLLDGAGSPCSASEGYRHEIGRIEAGETLDFEARVGFRDDAPFYRSVTLWLTVELGQLHDPESLRPIQHRAIEIRVARRYAPSDDADVLLVVNHKTTRAALDAWQALADEQGFVLNTYDLSLEKGIDLAAPHQQASLIERFAGKTIVILNPVVDTPAGAMSAHVLVDKHQILDAAANGVSVAFIGKGISISRLIAPTKTPPPSEHADTSALVRTVDETRLAVTHAARTEVFHTSMATRSPEHLARAAAKLSMALTRRYPHRRFFVIHSYDGTAVKRGVLFNRYRLGTLEIREACPPSGCLVRAKASEEELGDPAYIQGEANRMTLLLTKSFANKLEQLDALLAAGQDTGAIDLVVDAMLVDLANEQAALFETRWRHGLNRERMLEALPCLSRLAEFMPNHDSIFDASAPYALPVIRLVARLRYGAWARWRFWEWPLFVLRRAPLCALLTKDLTWRFLFNRVSNGSSPEETRAAMEVVSRALAVEAKNIRTAYKNDEDNWSLASDSPAGHEMYADRLLRAPLARAGLTTDSEVRDTWPERVLSDEELQELELEDQRRAEQRQAALDRWADSAFALQSSLSAEELLGE